MLSQEHIDNFSSTLTTILNREIELGNEIIETSQGWPNQGTIIIFLKKPFLGNYKIKNTEYRNVNDSHYWKAEYFDSSTNHVLVCKF
ncbi:hypothetical protein FEM21_11640 [Flavobacterium seoulense]|uniref:Uncharacterized protein n=1 Tax=Flavobacterium seoulense TaxID=1492738 RepID=A0A066WT85_9FLAO|nr:hypothetical protein FEM21_11640 [Flavobacterium seoulense]